MSRPVIIDCDPGHDDAIAILLALASPEVDLRLVTTVAGNTTLANATANAVRVLEFVGRGDVPVAAGCAAPLERPPFVADHVHGSTGLDGPVLPPPSIRPLPDHAVDLIAAVVEATPEPVTLIPTGPLTNLATLIDRHPAVAARLDGIVLMGGSIAEGNMTPAAEFNIWADPEAAHRVFESGLPVTMIGLDVTHRALATPAHCRRLRAAGRTGTMVAELIEFFTEYHRITYGWDGAPIHDALAVAAVIAPWLVTTKHVHVAVECRSDLCRGCTVVDVWRRTPNPANCHVAVDVRAEDFLEMLLERLGTYDSH
jgi:inosine-uridine nucleoside N-ribohydrolase